MSMMMANLYGTYRNMRFSEIFPDEQSFTNEFKATPLNNGQVSNVEIIYYLLYAEYANNPIANADINQFKYRVWATIFMYAPTWEKRLDIQRKIRALTEAEIQLGARTVSNHAMNDGGTPSTTALEGLDYINDQNVTTSQRSPLEGYAILMSMLEKDVTREFLNKFKPLFLAFVQPELPLLYADREYIDEEDII